MSDKRNIGNDIISSCMFDSENLQVAIERGISGDWFTENGELFRELVSLSGDTSWNQENSVNILDANGIYSKYSKALDISENMPDWSYSVERFSEAIEVFSMEYAKRVLSAKLQRATRELVNGEDPFVVAEMLPDAITSVEAIADTTKTRELPEIVASALEIDEVIASGEQIGLPFPWENFQRRTFGIPPKSVTPMAGRDGTGKSRLAIFITNYWMSLDIPILYMPFEDMAERFVSNMSATHGGYDMFDIKKNYVPTDFMIKHRQTMAKVSEMPLHVDDSSACVDRIVSRIASAKRKHGIKGVVIDGLKDIVLTNGENQTARENYINATLVRCAKKYDVSILTISHLTDLEDNQWISKRNIRGSKTQTQSARMSLMYQDSGLPDWIKKEYDILGGEVVLECQKASYGDKAVVVLRPELDKGRFVEVHKNEGY